MHTTINCFDIRVLTILLFRYKVYQVVPETNDQANLIHEIQYDNNFDFWSEIRLLNAPVDVMVAPLAQKGFEAVLNREAIEYSTIIENVQE